MTAKEIKNIIKDIPDDVDIEISMDVSTNDETYYHRIFGRIIEIISRGGAYNHPIHTISILCEETERNF